MMLAAADDGENVADADTGAGQPQLQFALALLNLEAAQDDQSLLHLSSTQRRSGRRHYVKSPQAEYAEMFKATGAISVFISRRDARIYLRKDAQPLFDLPIAISEPDRPLGTHVFTAVANRPDGRLRWMVVSPADPASGRDKADVRSVLDRLTVPQEAVEGIDALVSIGATVIVSDAGLGKTAAIPNADFAVVLH
jgi:hypothetical protein